MVSRYHGEEFNIWDDVSDPDVDEYVHQALLKAIGPKKITPKKGTATGTALMEKIIKEDIYKQLERFIDDWAGDIYVIPGELYSLYKNYCKENDEECLIPTSQAFGRRLSRYTDNGMIKRVLQNDIPYYIKPAALKVSPTELALSKATMLPKISDETAVIVGSVSSGDQTQLSFEQSGKKRSREENYESPQQPKKKRRLDSLATWSAAKEAEEFTLKISELEDQIQTLSRICREQKEIITRLSALQEK